MSAICLIDLKRGCHKMDFDEFNNMAKSVIRFALTKDLAAFFNSYDYGIELINDAKMENFFLMSDSFLYKDCDFLTPTAFTWETIEEFEEEFFGKYGFFTELLNIIFSYNINDIDIYLSGGGCDDSVEDFDVLKTNQKDFLRDLFNNIIEYSGDYAYGFPPIKYEVVKCKT